MSNGPLPAFGGVLFAARASTAPADGAAGFTWIWVVVGAVAVATLVLAGLASSVGTRRKRVAWHGHAKRLVQEGLVILDLADTRGRPTPYGIEMLVAVEDRLDHFLRSAGPVRKKAPSIRAKELIENLSHSGSTFAAAVAASRAIRDGVTAETARQQAFSTQRVLERMHEFDLNLREFSWHLDELP